MQSTVFVGALEPSQEPDASNATGLYRRGPQDEAWEHLHNGLPGGLKVLSIAAPPGDTRTIYIGTQLGLFRSTDGGDSWEDRSQGLVEFSKQPHLKSAILSDSDTEGMLDLHALAVSAVQPATVWIANRMGLFVSADRGDNWREFGITRFPSCPMGAT